MADELRNKHPEFKAVSLAQSNNDFVVAYGDKKFAESGNYAEPDFVEMLSLKMIGGDRNGLKDINSVLLSESLANKLFGDEPAVNKTVKLNNKQSAKVAGVYEDLPENSSFKDLHFIAPWEQYIADNESAKSSKDAWDNNSWHVYAQLKEGVDFEKASASIKDSRMKRANPPGYKPQFFLHPMSRWHLHSEFKMELTPAVVSNSCGSLGSLVYLFYCWPVSIL